MPATVEHGAQCRDLCGGQNSRAVSPDWIIGPPNSPTRNASLSSSAHAIFHYARVSTKPLYEQKVQSPERAVSLAGCSSWQFWREAGRPAGSARSPAAPGSSSAEPGRRRRHRGPLMGKEDSWFTPNFSLGSREKSIARNFKVLAEIKFNFVFDLFGE